MNYQIFKCFDKKMTKTTEPKGGSQKNVPKGGSQKIEPKGGSQKIVEPRGGSQKIEPRGGSQKIEPKGGSQKNVPKGESQKNVPKGGSQKIEPKGGSQKIEPKGGSQKIEPKGGSKQYKHKNIRGGTLSEKIATTAEQRAFLYAPETKEEKSLYSAINKHKDAAIVQRNTFEWWQSVYYYLLFKYKFNKYDEKTKQYSGFLIYEKIENTNADKHLPPTRLYTKDNITQYNSMENYHQFHLKYNEVLDKEKMEKEIWKPKNQELLKYLFHAGEKWSRDPRKEMNPRPTDPDVNQSDIITDIGITYKVNVMKKEGPKYIIEDNKLDKLIKHCQEQFIAGRTPIRNPPLGDPFFSKMNDQHDSLISVFIHYTINNFKQQINQMNLCFNQNQEEQSEQDKEL